MVEYAYSGNAIFFVGHFKLQPSAVKTEIKMFIAFLQIIQIIDNYINIL